MHLDAYLRGDFGQGIAPRLSIIGAATVAIEQIELFR